MSRCGIVLVLCALALSAGPGAAQLRDPGSSIRDDVGGFGFVLDANYLSPRGCDFVAGFRHGAPAGARVHHDAMAVTILVDTSDRSCGRQGPRVVRELRPIDVSIAPLDVHVFFVTTSGRLLKHDLIAFSP